MVLDRFDLKDFNQLIELQKVYKQSINEDTPTVEEFERLHQAIYDNQIEFFVAQDDNELVAMCSVCKTFSTFNYKTGGAFEDFYIIPSHRHKGLAQKLVKYAFDNSRISSLTVGCADCDVDMYKAIGFTVTLGNMMAYNN